MFVGFQATKSHPFQGLDSATGGRLLVPLGIRLQKEAQMLMLIMERKASGNYRGLVYPSLYIWLIWLLVLLFISFVFSVTSVIVIMCTEVADLFIFFSGQYYSIFIYLFVCLFVCSFVSSFIDYFFPINSVLLIMISTSVTPIRWEVGRWEALPLAPGGWHSHGGTPIAG